MTWRKHPRYTLWRAASHNLRYRLIATRISVRLTVKRWRLPPEGFKYLLFFERNFSIIPQHQRKGRCLSFQDHPTGPPHAQLLCAATAVLKEEYYASPETFHPIDRHPGNLHCCPVCAQHSGDCRREGAA